MSPKKLLLASTFLALALPLGSASAHDDAYRHRSDHAEHGDFHDRAERAHEAAHEYGLFENGRDHRRFHHRYDHAHEGFHEDHPRTFHDHRRSGYDD